MPSYVQLVSTEYTARLRPAAFASGLSAMHFAIALGSSCCGGIGPMMP